MNRKKNYNKIGEDSDSNDDGDENNNDDLEKKNSRKKNNDGSTYLKTQAHKNKHNDFPPAPIVPLLAMESVPSQSADQVVYTAGSPVSSVAAINFSPLTRTKTLPVVTTPLSSHMLQPVTPLRSDVPMPNPLVDGEWADNDSLQTPTSGIFISADALKALLTGQAEAKLAHADMKKTLENHSRMLQELLREKDHSDDSVLDSLNLPIDSREDLKTFERLLRSDSVIFGKLVSIFCISVS